MLTTVSPITHSLSIAAIAIIPSHGGRLPLGQVISNIDVSNHRNLGTHVVDIEKPVELLLPEETGPADDVVDVLDGLLVEEMLERPPVEHGPAQLQHPPVDLLLLGVLQYTEVT